MICPSCGHDNIEGADRCEECVTSLLKIDPEAEQEGMASSVMENDISQLEQEFLGVSPDTSAVDVMTSPTAAPRLPPMKRKSIAAIAIGWPPSQAIPASTASSMPVVARALARRAG